MVVLERKDKLPNSLYAFRYQKAYCLPLIFTFLRVFRLKFPNAKSNKFISVGTRVDKPFVIKFVKYFVRMNPNASNYIGYVQAIQIIQEN